MRGVGRVGVGMECGGDLGVHCGLRAVYNRVGFRRVKAACIKIVA